MISRKCIVIVDPLSSARHYGSLISQLGFQPVALLTRKRFVGLQQRFHSLEGYAEVRIAFNINQAMALLKGLNVKALIPGSDSALRFIDELAERLGLVGNPWTTSISRYNKFELKKKLVACGVDATPSALLTPINQAHLEPDLNFPLVIKPSQGSGSRNVKICHTLQDFKAACDSIANSKDGEISGENDIIAETYLEGTEYFITTANMGNNNRKMLCFAQYEKLNKNGHASIYKNITSLPITGPLAEIAQHYAEQVNTAIEANYGINDIEIKIHDDRPLIIEQNGRLPGANVPMMIETCTGISCYRLNLEIYISGNARPIESVNYFKHFCICCLISERNGKIDSLTGLDKLNTLSSFHSMDILSREGDYIPETIDFLSAWGFVYLINEDLNLLEADAAFVHENLKIIYR